MVDKTEVSGAQPDVWSQIWGPFNRFGRQVAEYFAPNAEASGSSDAYEIKVELPGVADADIKVDVHDRRLSIAGEKSTSKEEKDKHYYFSERVYGAFRRSFQLPEDADADAIKAEHKDGLLTIRVPRRVPKGAAPKRIEINN